MKDVTRRTRRGKESRGERYSLRAAVIVAAMLAGGCGDGGNAGGGSGPDALDRVVRWRGTIEMEEPGEAVLDRPTVAVDPLGGFLVTEDREGQVRRYGRDGRLLWRAGRRGSGPGEFPNVAGAVRLPSGDLLAVDRDGRLTRYDSAGALLNTVETRIHRVEALEVVDDSTVLIGGALEGEPDGPKLHLWDLPASRLKSSFFAPVRNAPNPVVAVVAGWVKASVRGDTIAAIFAPADTVFLFTTAGGPIGKLPLPSRFFRHGTREAPAAGSGPRDAAQYLRQFDFVEAVFWLPDGTLLVPYQSPVHATERRRHLLHVDRAGRRLFETRDGPRLLEADSRDGTLYFVHPQAEAPNRWSVARLRG